MPRLFQQSESTAGYRRFPIYLVDNVSGLYPITGETGNPQLSKNGAAWSSTSSAVTEVGNGHYYVALTQAELDTLGYLGIRYKSSSTAEFNMDGQVVSFDPYAATNLGLSNLDQSLSTTESNIRGANDSTLMSVSGVVERGKDLVLTSGDTRWLTATGFSTLTQAQVNTEVDTALADINLDHLVKSAVDTDWATTVNANSVVGYMADTGASAFDRSTDSQEAIYNNQASASSIADAVWDETLSDHDTDGSTGHRLASISGQLDTIHDNILASGDTKWLTATGFSTLTQSDILSDATPFAGANIDQSLSTTESNIKGDGGYTLTSISGVIEEAKNVVLSSGDTRWLTATGFSTHTEDDVWADGVRASGMKLDVKVSTRSTLAQSDILSDATAFAGANIDQSLSTTESNIKGGGGYSLTSISGIVEEAKNVVLSSGDTRWLTATGFSTLTQAEVNTEVDTALADINLDHLVKNAVDTDWPTTVHANSVIGYVADSGSSVFNRVTDSQQSIRDNQAGADTAAIADAVWDEALSDHTTGGSAGQRLASISGQIGTIHDNILASGDTRWLTATGFSTHSAGDVWADGIRASGAKLDVKISTRSTLAQSDILSDATTFAGANIDQSLSTTESNIKGGGGYTLTSLSGIVEEAKNVVLSSGDTRWLTATGFSTHSAGDVWADGIRASGAKLDVKISTRSTLSQSDILSDATPFAGANIDQSLSTTESNIKGDGEYTLTSISGVIEEAKNVVLSSGDTRWITATGFSTLTQAQVNTEVDTALSDINLDHLVKNAVDTNWATTVNANSVMGYIADSGSSVFNRLTDSQQAIRDNQTGADTAAIADAVWDEVLGDHSTAGSTGQRLASLSGIVETAQDTILASGDTRWLTATGFSTHTANQVWADGIRASGAKLDVKISTRSTLSQSDILSDSTAFAGANIDQAISTTESNIRGPNSSTLTSLSGVVERGKDLILSSGDTRWATATGFSTHSAADVADSVWDETLSDHTSAGSTAQRLSSVSGQIQTLETHGDSTWATATGLVTISGIWGHTTRTVTAATNITSDGVAISGQNGVVDANMARIYDSDESARNLRYSASTIVRGQAATGTLSTTEMTTNLTETTNDHYNGRIIIWYSGNLTGQATDITDYTGSNKKLTYTAVTEAPSAGDKFVIV